MKIALSSTGKNFEDNLDPRFGRCEYFLIYDTEKEEVEAIENEGKISGGGAGIAAAQQIINESVDVIITGNLGPNAYDLIKDAEIKAYRGESISCTQVIEKYNSGKLEEIKIAGPSHKGIGQGYRGGK